jgi:GT2 family glycosyltransferase
MTDLVSVVIPAYNAEATIGACVQAVRDQAFEGPVELIVVDDGSTDGTAAAARAAGAIVITTPRGRPAAARNAGLRAACGPIICYTDADCAPHPNWLREITAPFADPGVAACKGSYATQQTALVARFVQIEYEDKYDRLRRQATIDFIDTYSAAYRRDVLLVNGGFDEQFDYAEDQELSFRLAARGCRMLFREAAVVDHRHTATLRGYLRKKAIIGYWKAQVVRRHPGRAVSDSHTPQVMKVQMALATLALAALAAGGVGAALGWGWAALAPAGAALFLFATTTLPFARKAWRKDRGVALAAPAVLFGRAVALAAGFAWGVLRPRRGLVPPPAEQELRAG